jgi:hypothetical protein
MILDAVNTSHFLLMEGYNSIVNIKTANLGLLVWRELQAKPSRLPYAT